MAFRLSRFIPLLLPLAGLLAGCEGDPGSRQEQQIAPLPYSGWYRPGTGTSWHWQLQGEIDTSLAVDMYDIDLFDSSPALIASLQASGRKVICYFSAGSWEDWRDDASDFPAKALGAALDDWEGERWLDVRSTAVRSIMQRRLDLAASKGCDGVEPDNMDGYSNESGFPLTPEDQLDYNRFIANAAHQRKLAAGLKNDTDQLAGLVDYYDFAVNEQCFTYEECDGYSLFTSAGKAVFNAEYDDEYVADPQLICPRSVELELQTLILPLELDGSFRIDCRNNPAGR